MIKSKRDLQFNYLGYSYEEVRNILNDKNAYYYSFKRVKKDSDGRPKIKNGIVQKRLITPSKDALRDIQNRIKDKILTKLPLPACVKGGVKKQDTISNANVHKGKPHRFQTDLEKFFPSISEQMVYEMFLDYDFSPEIARLLAQLVTKDDELNFRKRSLPQGAPTSTAIANLVFAKIDLQILELIKGKNIAYTRWVDDLTFSSPLPLDPLLSQNIIRIIAANGFKINRKKTSQRSKRSVITGIDTGSTLRVTKEFREKEKLITSEQARAGRNNFEKRVKEANFRKRIA